MKPINTPNFYTNFTEDKMTESVKVANYRGSAYEGGHLQQFEKYANGAANHDNIDNAFEREEKLMGNEMIELGGNTRQIKTEYSQVSNIESGFQKVKTNQAEMLKELRSEYDNLKSLPMDRNNQPKQHSSHSSSPSPSQSHSESHREETSEVVSSSIPTSKPQKRERKSRPRERESSSENYKREERLWVLERKRYEEIVKDLEEKIVKLLQTEMEYKRTIYEYKNPCVQPTVAEKVQPQENQLEYKVLLREEKDKSHNLQSELEQIRSLYQQEREKCRSLEDENKSQHFDSHKFREELQKYQNLYVLEKEKFMQSDIDKRRSQMEYDLLKKDKDAQIERLHREVKSERHAADRAMAERIRKHNEELDLLNKRYNLLLRQLQKSQKEHHSHSNNNSKMNDLFEEVKKTLSQSRSTQNEELYKTFIEYMKKVQEERNYSSSEQSSQRDDEEMNGLREEVTRLKTVIRELRDNKDMEILKRYEDEIRSLKEKISILEKRNKDLERKVREKPVSPAPSLSPVSPPTPSRDNYEIIELKKKNMVLEGEIKEKQTLLMENERLYLLYKGKWEDDETEIRSLRRQVDEVSFEYEKSKKELDSRTSMMGNERQAMQRIMKQDVEKANANADYWRREFENVKSFYEQRIAEKNRIIEEASTAEEMMQVKKDYERNLSQARESYEREIAQLVDRVSDPALLKNAELSEKYTQLEISYSELLRHAKKSKQLSEGVDHLWGIKETEYNNVNEILRQVVRRSSNPEEHRREEFYEPERQAASSFYPGNSTVYVESVNPARQNYLPNISESQEASDYILDKNSQQNSYMFRQVGQNSPMVFENNRQLESQRIDAMGRPGVFESGSLSHFNGSSGNYAIRT